MIARSASRRSPVTPVGVITTMAIGIAAVAALLGIASVGLAALLSGAGAPRDWDEVGEAFGVANSVFSALALIVVGLTLWVQYRELKMQRAELHEQRLTAEQSTTALAKNAEANLRARHAELLRMAIDDAALAAVWPPYGEDVSPERARQFMYANLIIQHQSLGFYNGTRDRGYVKNNVRICFSSPIVREFWRRTMEARLVAGTADEGVTAFVEICDEAYAESSADKSEG
jgi:hypothetical protein